jgi:hypothetical protein
MRRLFCSLIQGARAASTALCVTIGRLRCSARVKRIRRFTLDLATGASAVFCVISIALWTHSYWGDSGQFTLHGRPWGWSSRHGSLGANDAAAVYLEQLRGMGLDPDRDLAGQTIRDFGVLPRHISQFHVDYWIVTLLTIALPVWRWRTEWRHKRLPQGTLPCDQCGYDLRATPDRCPECGAVPTARAARAGGAEG